MNEDDRESAMRAGAQAGDAIEKTAEQLAAFAGQLQTALTSDDDGEAVTRGDLEAGLRFVHHALAHARDQLSSLNVAHEALLSTLAASGHIEAETLADNRKLPVLRERERRSLQPDVRLSDVVDKYELTDGVTIDCLDRLPLCHARCCGLDFELAEQDLDEGVIRWDYGTPYVVKKDDTGRCVHNADGKCGVYGARPASCRQYDCRDDRRIWLDFENRIPAP